MSTHFSCRRGQDQGNVVDSDVAGRPAPMSLAISSTSGVGTPAYEFSLTDLAVKPRALTSGVAHLRQRCPPNTERVW